MPFFMAVITLSKMSPASLPNPHCRVDKTHGDKFKHIFEAITPDCCCWWTSLIKVASGLCTFLFEDIFKKVKYSDNNNLLFCQQCDICVCRCVTTDVLNSERLQTKPSWPELCPARPLPPPHRLTFDSAFGGQFAAVALCRPHYFLFPLSALTLCRVAGLGRQVRGREEEGKDAGQTRATAASWEDWPAWSLFEPPTLQLSVTRRPQLGVGTTHQPELMELAADAAKPPPTISTKKQVTEGRFW